MDLSRTVGHQFDAIDHLVIRSGIRGLLILVADLRGFVSGTLSIRCQICYILTTNAVFEVKLLALEVLSELLDAAALHRCLWILAIKVAELELNLKLWVPDLLANLKLMPHH